MRVGFGGPPLPPHAVSAVLEEAAGAEAGAARRMAGRRDVRVRWRPGLDCGLRMGLQYVIEDGSGRVVGTAVAPAAGGDGDERDAVVTLDAGRSYMLRVAAQNALGRGNASAAAPPLAVPSLQQLREARARARARAARPRDCAVSQWGAWGPCDLSCRGGGDDASAAAAAPSGGGTGTRRRSRSITRSASHGGAACGPLHQAGPCALPLRPLKGPHPRPGT